MRRLRTETVLFFIVASLFVLIFIYVLSRDGDTEGSSWFKANDLSHSEMKQMWEGMSDDEKKAAKEYMGR